ncbi:transmembrane protein [Heterostelium album PN500]|uniref:Transmembrane protein n=1 Tax=Heterostelium pallidum (strain ATCC 26659 / Pp 5 / PN500) TaxID=670386 RepID=D3BSQ6_HETP5|nr:transmembrane protein [Heterostelium album PN500]EFA75521.1 transmembrane protein [Heterostelium album PN500]|eukprot:XP_020427655.1 transmembrane protein [Heterostelium album PN500]
MNNNRISALAFPDLTDLTQPGEIPNFFVQHYALLIAPVVIHMYKFPTRFHIGYALMSTGICGLAHHVVFEICSLISGININYMLFPPPLGFDLNELLLDLTGGRVTANVYRCIIGPLLNLLSWPLGAIAIATANFIAYSLYNIRLGENIKQKVN